MKENKKKENKKEQGRYEAPQLTVVSFRTERGFASSSPLGIVGESTSQSSSEPYDYAGDLWSY